MARQAMKVLIEEIVRVPQDLPRRKFRRQLLGVFELPFQPSTTMFDEGTHLTLANHDAKRRDVVIMCHSLGVLKGASGQLDEIGYLMDVIDEEMSRTDYLKFCDEEAGINTITGRDP
jgi:hypothetical protein